MSEQLPGFNTRAIHAGQEPDAATGAVNVPVHLSTTFKQDGVGLLAGVDRPGVEAGKLLAHRATPVRWPSTSCRVTTPAGLPSTCTTRASAEPRAPTAAATGSPEPMIGSGADMCRSTRS